MRISIKLLIISEAVLLIAVLSLVVPIWLAMRGEIVLRMQDDLKSVAATAALGIDGDLHRTIRSADDASGAAFLALRHHLARVRAANDIELEQIYTFYPDGDQVRFAVMLHDTPFIGDTYELRDEMRPVLETGATATTELYRDDHGAWISAYAPIHDSGGAIVGLVEVDKNAATYFAVLRSVTWRVVIIAGVAFIFSSLLGWIVLQRLVITPLSAVREGMLAISRQEFTHVVRLRTGDEFQDLADTFNSLASQLNVARTVQMSFFPERMPARPGYCVAGVSVPCDATGGDYYDAFELEGGRIAIVVGDVSGHGLGPSLLMATCRSALRALATADLPPGELVGHLNRLLVNDLAEGSFITMIYGVLDEDGILTWSNAGHGPALVRRGGKVVQLDSHRPPLGLDFELPLEAMQSSIRLAPGDRVLFASDGVPEAMDRDGRMFGVGPIEALMADGAATCTEVVQILKAQVMEHVGRRSANDDVTILCVDVRDS